MIKLIKIDLCKAPFLTAVNLSYICLLGSLVCDNVMIVLSFGLFIHFTEESVIEAVDVNGTRELERLPDNFDGRFGCVLLLKVFEIFLAKYNCMLTWLLEFFGLQLGAAYTCMSFIQFGI